MVISDRHIAYLELVERGQVVLKNHHYTGTGVDHITAVHVEILGLTHITSGNVVALTARGVSVLNDEREAWG